MEDQDVDERVILELSLKKWDGIVWTSLIWHRIGQGTDFCENSTELWAS